MIPSRVPRLPPALQFRHANFDMMRSLQLRRALPPRLLSSMHHHHHHHHGHSASFPTSGVALFGSTRRAIASTVSDRIQTRLGISTIAPSCYNGPDHCRPRRFLSSQNYDDFDIPPLDLTTPSLSIPLPPNMMRDKISINGDVVAANSKGKIDIETLLKPSSTPIRSHETNKNTVDEPLGGGGSFLGEGIEKMKKRLLDGQLTSKQRGKLRNTLQGKFKKEVLTRHIRDGTTEWSGAERNERLLELKKKTQKGLDEFLPRLTKGSPPKITGGKRGEALSKIMHGIKKTESEYLDTFISKDEEEKLGNKLIALLYNLHRLEETGLTPNQYKKITKRTSPIQRQPRMKETQREFYAESSGPTNPPKISAMQPGILTAPPKISAMQPGILTAQRPPSPPAVLAPRRSQGSGQFPSPDFVGDLITTQANGTILGQAGSTAVLSTVVLAQHPSQSSFSSSGAGGDNSESADKQTQSAARKILLGAIHRADAQSGAAFVPLQVDYRERFHASGKIPGNRRRRDNGGPLSDREVLAARVVDRTVRPWLLTGLASSSSSSFPENIVVNCEVQSYDPRPFGDASQIVGQRTHADPTTLAINSTIAALYRSAYSSPNSNLPVPSEAAACVKLAILRDGTVIVDPTPKELVSSKLELLYAGTRDRVLMLEFSANGGLPREDDINGQHSVEDPGIAESMAADAIRLAHEAIIPIIEKQEQLRDKYIKEIENKALEKNEALMTDEEVARLLGLESSPLNASFEVNLASHVDPISDSQDGMRILYEANFFVWSKVKHVALKLFGYNREDQNSGDPTVHGEGTARIHDDILLPKKVRGRRENILQAEISRLLRDEFVPIDGKLATFYRSALHGGDSSKEFIVALTNHIHEGTMKNAMTECARKNLRSDGRRGRNVVRPISATAPIFPDSVHGSSLFSRGETQVMCTVTVGAPKEGLPIADPYAEILNDGSGKDKEKGDDDNIPVGSLRFLRNQAEMESDMNSKRVLAGREMTGDSGILSEVKRAFLHYDFPDFSTGVVKSRVGASANRRAIGHGNLAEKAILPALPHRNNFPYAIRLTCEVTSSNGSSSMASACAASLALLDAGIPVVSPVAGVSIGLAPGSNELLLDITGTEDHYGDMDFKICGTYGGITAMQLDVKRPLPVENILDALDLAKEGRHAILNAMEKECKNTLPGLHPRTSMKSTAPRVEVIKFDPNRKRDLIGPGGAVLRQLEDRFKISLDLSQEGRCLIFGSLSSVSKAKNVIMDLVSDVEEGGVYEGTVIEIKDFGAVIELLRNKEGLLHVSEITDSSVRHPGGNIGLVKEHLKVGDKIEVLCTKIDHVQGSIKLSRKKLMQMRKNNYSQFGSSREAVQKDEVEDDMDEIAQLINTMSEEPDEDCSDDDDTDDDVEYNTDMADDEESANYTVSQSIEARWMERYNELKQYKSANGHCNVPTRYTENIKLGNWVSYNRAQYKKGISPEDRVQRLSDIGFAWCPDRNEVAEARWIERYNELKQYKSANGHCNVPGKSHSEYPKLGFWVKHNRALYKKGGVLEDRVQRLNDIGFAWSLKD